MQNLAHKNRNPSRWLAAVVAMAAIAVPANAMALGFVISEVLFKPSVNPDDGSQWLELYNGTASSIDLTQFSLGWGSKDYLDGTLYLADYLVAGTTLAPGDTYVIGGPNTGAFNGDPIYDLVYNFDKDLRKGNKNDADGIALFQLDGSSPAERINALSVPYFTVIYGKPGAKVKLLDELGGLGSVDVSQNPWVGGESIAIDSAFNWKVATTPTPGAVIASPEPGTGVLLGAGLIGLAISGRRRRRFAS